MEAGLVMHCQTIYQAALSSGLGASVVDFFATSGYLESRGADVLRIREKLDNGAYANPEKWLEDVRLCFHEIARDMGSESDIGLSMLTLLQLVEDASKPLFCREPRPVRAEFDSVINQLREIMESTPNNLEEFQMAVTTGPEALPGFMFTPDAKEMDAATEDFDLPGIYKGVMNLKTDKDLEKVVDVVTKYELLYSHVKGVLEIDLTKCQPYTLKLLQDVITRANDKKRKTS
jgi:hypothetical protein